MKILLKNQVYYVQNDPILVVKDLFYSDQNISSRMYKCKMSYFSN